MLESIQSIETRENTDEHPLPFPGSADRAARCPSVLRRSLSAEVRRGRQGGTIAECAAGPDAGMDIH